MSARVSDIPRAASFLAGEGEMEGGGCYEVRRDACELPQRDPQRSAVGFGALCLGARVITEPGRWEPSGTSSRGLNRRETWEQGANGLLITALPGAAVVREGSYRLAPVPCRGQPCRAVPCHAAAWARRGAVGCGESAETCVSLPTEKRGCK